MRKVLAAGVAVAALAAGSAEADFWDGNTLFDACTGERLVKKTACLGFIAGVFDMLEPETACLPKGITLGQAADTVKKFLADHPELRHFSAAALGAAAASEAFPCEIASR